MNQREPGWGSAMVSSQLPAVFQLGYSFRNEDPSYWAIRGSEQIQIEYWRNKGISGNRYDGIRSGHKNESKFRNAAKTLKDWFKF